MCFVMLLSTIANATISLLNRQHAISVRTTLDGEVGYIALGHFIYNCLSKEKPQIYHLHSKVKPTKAFVSIEAHISKGAGITQ